MDSYTAGFIALLVLQWLFVIGRVLVRCFIVRKFGGDDIAAIITLIFSSAYCGVSIAVIEFSESKPLLDITPSHIRPSAVLTLCDILMYIVAAAAFKVALGLLLLRVLVKPWQVYTIYSVMCICILWSTACFFLDLFQCGNPNDFYPNIALGRCYSQALIYGFTYTHAAVNAVADLIFAVLPIFLLKDAAMSLKSKISVGIILSLGSLGVVISFVRLGYVHTLVTPTFTFFVNSGPIAILSASELAVGLICLSISTFKPLIWRILGRDLYYPYSEYYLQTHSQPEVIGNQSGSRRDNAWPLPNIPCEGGIFGGPKTHHEDAESVYAESASPATPTTAHTNFKRNSTIHTLDSDLPSRESDHKFEPLRFG